MGFYSDGINHNSSSSSMVLSWQLYHELPDHSRSERVLEPGFLAVACQLNKGSSDCTTFGHQGVCSMMWPQSPLLQPSM